MPCFWPVPEPIGSFCCGFGWFLFSPENSHNIVRGYDKEVVIRLKIDRNGVFWVKQDFVVLAKGQVFVVFDGGGNRDDTPSNRGDFCGIRQSNAAFGLPFGFVLANENTQADRLHKFKNISTRLTRWAHFSPVQKLEFDTFGIIRMKYPLGLENPRRFAKIGPKSIMRRHEFRCYSKPSTQETDLRAWVS